MIKKFCKKYKLPENTLHELLSHMAEVRFSKGELIISEGERNSNFYLLKKGIWRAYYLTDGTETPFGSPHRATQLSHQWGYVDSEVSLINICNR
jgi:cAMP-binding proteins - catabolite gene activator and regulatory subunit of cAMP-dependent protein kinases